METRGSPFYFYGLRWWCCPRAHSSTAPFNASRKGAATTSSCRGPVQHARYEWWRTVENGGRYSSRSDKRPHPLSLHFTQIQTSSRFRLPGQIISTAQNMSISLFVCVCSLSPILDSSLHVSDLSYIRVHQPGSQRNKVAYYSFSFVCHNRVNVLSPFRIRFVLRISQMYIIDVKTVVQTVLRTPHCRDEASQWFSSNPVHDNLDTVRGQNEGVRGFQYASCACRISFSAMAPYSTRPSLGCKASIECHISDTSSL